MASGEIRVGDIGTKFLATVEDDGDVVDVSGASTKELIFEKPDGAQFTKDASFETDGTDGQIFYKSVDGDLDTEGLWKLQGHIVTPDGEWKTDIVGFQVHENL